MNVIYLNSIWQSMFHVIEIFGSIASRISAKYSIMRTSLQSGNMLTLQIHNATALWYNLVQGYPFMQYELSDGELIRRYLQEKDESAFEQLLNRHYDLVYRRFLNRCKNAEDAADLSQQLWLRVLNNLKNYQDDGKFPFFLMRSVSNLLTDHWRRKGVRDNVIDDLVGSDDFDPIAEAKDSTVDLYAETATQEEVQYLISHLIPALNCELRMAFLLRHESEYWEGQNRLGWHHLAELTNQNQDDVWSRFEALRNTLMTLANGRKSDVSPDCEDLLIFTVWTQAQRLHKAQNFTWDYFSEILNVPVNTMKTRYRTALKQLAQGLKNREESSE